MGENKRRSRRKAEIKEGKERERKEAADVGRSTRTRGIGSGGKLGRAAEGHHKENGNSVNKPRDMKLLLADLISLSSGNRVLPREHKTYLPTASCASGRGERGGKKAGRGEVGRGEPRGV